MAQQAVIVRFKKFSDRELLYSLEDELRKLITPGLGELDGHEIATDLSEGTLYFYGPDAEALWEHIEAAIRATPFMRKAEVVIRYGPPKARSKKIVLK